MQCESHCFSVSRMDVSAVMLDKNAGIVEPRRLLQMDSDRRDVSAVKFEDRKPVKSLLSKLMDTSRCKFDNESGMSPNSLLKENCNAVSPVRLESRVGIVLYSRLWLRSRLLSHTRGKAGTETQTQPVEARGSTRSAACCNVLKPNARGGESVR